MRATCFLCSVVFTMLFFSIETNAQTIFRTYTTLSGFYDYQSNGAVNQYIRVCPTSGNMHAIYMIAFDSSAGGLNNSRRTAYAFSSNGGLTWNNFSNVTVPARRSGFPTLDLMRGRYACLPVIANHSVNTSLLQSSLFVDSPEGCGCFSELNAPPLIGGDEPIWPEIACTSDGAIVMVASTQASCRTYIWRIDSVYRPPKIVEGVCGGRNVAEASLTDSGRVGVALGNPQQINVGMYFYESTDNGITWPNLPTYILPSIFTVGTDSFQTYPSLDFAYKHNNPVISFTVFNGRLTGTDRAGIGFWSPPTGFVLAVPHNAISGVADSMNKTQRNHLTVGYPAIAMSGSNIVIVFQVFMQDTSARGFNYSEVLYTYSSNNGTSWSSPRNITNTRFLDERYPSISKWNANGQINLVYQEDTAPGLAAFPGDGSDTVRTKQVFCRVSDFTLDVNEKNTPPLQFALEQNYPNPFNPSTTLSFVIGHSSFVILKVYDVLGREVATLVNEVKAPGEHVVQFEANNLSSGVYYYRLSAGSFIQTKKMILIR